MEKSPDAFLVPGSIECSPEQRYRDAVTRWFHPAGVYTFVGAGGKSTAMMRTARVLAETGLNVCMTTTTRVGTDEFAGFPVVMARGIDDLQRSQGCSDRIVLLVGGIDEHKRKMIGVAPSLIEGLRPRSDTVVLVEGDGARRLPMKAPKDWEPVIPANSTGVLALMGARAFDEPINELWWYNHEKALTLLGKIEGRLGAEEIATLAADNDGCRKGVQPGMEYRLFINQGDLELKRETARNALRFLKERWQIDGALVSFQKGRLYEDK